MREVLVLCEGQTEREFCRSVVAPHLGMSNVALSGTLVGKPNRKRGGISRWPVYRDELLRLASERADRHVAVLVDYYAMPTDWPGRSEAPMQPAAERAAFVEAALKTAMADKLGPRFHPCVQLHEFESLMFVDPQVTARVIEQGALPPNRGQLAQRLEAIRTACGGSVELINDSPEDAPSKRLLRLAPGYDKVAFGQQVAIGVGLTKLREACPWLDRWLNCLEAQGT